MPTDNKINIDEGVLSIHGPEWNGRIGELEPATADNELDPLQKVPDNVTLELKISPEQAAAIVESLKPTIEKIKQAFRQIGEQLTQTFKKIVVAARKSADEYMDNLLYCANDNPRWWHLYKHAKKWRTRKKYRNKLMQQLRRKLAAEAVT